MTNDPRKKKPAAPPEKFIGHESMTMMGDETFADFEKRLKASEGATAPVPAHTPAKSTKPVAPAAKAPPAPAAKPPPPAPKRPAPPPPEPEEEDDDEATGIADDEDAAEAEGDDGLDLPDEYDGAGEDEDDGDESDGDDGDADDDDDDSDDSRRGQHARPGFRPKDRDGVEWDYVTHEGVGFNDDDDEDAMTLEKNGKTYFKPDWGGWKHDDWVGYWKKHFEIEQSQEKGEKHFQATLKKHGLRNRNHWKRATATFLRHYGNDPEFTNAALVARQEETREKMRSAVKPGMLDPVEGVSLQVWAAINAKLVSGGDLKKLLAPHKIDEAKWARASDTWNARMSDQSNPDAAMAIATEYGKAFAGGGVGAYGASAQAASSSMGINDKVAGKKVKGAEPVSFERWVEIQSAQGAWAQQGKDVNAMLKKVFGLTAVDWSNMSAHWSQKLSTDISLATKYGELNAKYTAKYSAGEADPDGDLEV